MYRSCPKRGIVDTTILQELAKGHISVDDAAAALASGTMGGGKGEHTVKRVKLGSQLN